MLAAHIIDEANKEDFLALLTNKSPGPNGYTAEFFKKMYSVIGLKLTKAAREFFDYGRMLKQWNNTAMTLVPKKPNADKITYFRPISCNVFTK